MQFFPLGTVPSHAPTEIFILLQNVKESAIVSHQWTSIPASSLTTMCNSPAQHSAAQYRTAWYSVVTRNTMLYSAME